MWGLFFVCGIGLFHPKLTENRCSKIFRIPLKTASASFRFLRPVYIGEKVRIVCKVKVHENRSIKLQGWILNPAGKKCTVVKGEYREIDREMYEKIIAGR